MSLNDSATGIAWICGPSRVSPSGEHSVHCNEGPVMRGQSGRTAIHHEPTEKPSHLSNRCDQTHNASTETQDWDQLRVEPSQPRWRLVSAGGICSLVWRLLIRQIAARISYRPSFTGFTEDVLLRKRPSRLEKNGPADCNSSCWSGMLTHALRLSW